MFDKSPVLKTSACLQKKPFDCAVPRRAQGCEGPFIAACSFNFYYFLHCRTILKTSKLQNNTLNYAVKVLKKQNVSYFRILKVATVCLDDSFAHYWQYLNQLHEVVTWNGFQ